MLKKTIQFEDLDGNPVTKDFYFHLSIDDLTDWEASKPGGVEKYLSEILEAGNRPEILAMFKELIGRSVGERSEDNTSFIKNDQIRQRFMGSDAYSVMLLEMFADGDAAIEFFNGVMPKKLKAQIDAMAASGKLELSEVPAKPKTLDDYSMTQLANMPYAAFDQLMRQAPPGSLSKEHLQLAFQRRP